MVKLGVDTHEMDLLNLAAHEEVELHGNDFVILYIPLYVENTVIHDPLYGEPAVGNDSYKFTPYNIKGHYRDYSTQEVVGEEGETTEWTQTLDVTVAHLEEAGVPKDNYFVDKIFTGAVIAVKILGAMEYFDIIQTEHAGTSHREGGFTHIVCDLKQTTKFSASRVIGDNE